jgi:hypothetical protein
MNLCPREAGAITLSSESVIGDMPLHVSNDPAVPEKR